MIMFPFARAVPVVIALSFANVAHAVNAEPYVGCFEATEIDAMNYVDASLARKILTRQRDGKMDDLRVTLKMARQPDGTVSEVSFLKRSDLPELDEASRRIALASKILCPNQPDLAWVVDGFRWSMHLSANENAGRIDGTALTNRLIRNFREDISLAPSHGQACDVIRDGQGVATMANCNLAGQCLPRKLIEPGFPLREYAKGLSGITQVEGIVDENGKLKSVKVLRSSGNSKMDDAAVRAFEALELDCKGPKPNRRFTISYDFGKPVQPLSRRR